MGLIGYTAAEVPGNRYVGLIENDWPVFVAIGEETRCTGDIIAGVVADTQRLARKAAELIDIEYEVLAPVTDPNEALKPGAPLVHPERGTNLLSKSVLKRGDVEEGFRRAAHIIEDRITCPSPSKSASRTFRWNQAPMG
jgi:aldehyde oxidoreductase